MKGFPNQIADLRKLGRGLSVAAELIAAEQNPKDDGIYGAALVRAGVAGTGHRPRPVEEYLREQEAKPRANRGHRTAARGLRELYRLLGFIDDAGPQMRLTALGRQAAAFPDQPVGAAEITFWRTALTGFAHMDASGTSHPYQVLLRLVASCPGITRAKCALALEAADDSPEELQRIVQLAQLDEAQIRNAINISEANWDNAKKMLPRFAEQLGDVIKTGQTFILAEEPGRIAAMRDGAVAAEQGDAGERAPRAPRHVTPETIGQAGMGERAEPPVPPGIAPEQMAAAIAIRADRLRRHNLLVRELAAFIMDEGDQLYEDPFDALILRGGSALLVEVKTLDGSAADERDQVRDSLAQLLYYEAFVLRPIAGDRQVTKAACFESQLAADHAAWLQGQGIAVLWKRDGRFRANGAGAPWGRRFQVGI